jgi:hypothetical protein
LSEETPREIQVALKLAIAQYMPLTMESEDGEPVNLLSLGMSTMFYKW